LYLVSCSYWHIECAGFLEVFDVPMGCWFCDGKCEETPKDRATGKEQERK
jgi:hypothetical protein